MNRSAYLAALGIPQGIEPGGLPLVRLGGRPVTLAEGLGAEALAVAARRASPLVVVATGAPASSPPPPRPAGGGPWPVVAVGDSPWTVRGADLGLLVGVAGPADHDLLDEGRAAELTTSFVRLAFDGSSRPPAATGSLLGVVPFAIDGPYDAEAVLRAVVDGGDWVELDRGAAPEVLTALARLDGRSVGVALSRPDEHRGAIGPAGAARIERLVRLCETAPGAPRPLVSLVDADGVRLSDADGVRLSDADGVAGSGPGPTGDAVRALRDAATAVRRSPVPKVVVVLGRATGLGATLLAAVGARADLVLPWPRARFSAASGEEPGTGATAGDGAIAAAAQADVMDVIHPDDTRARLAEALELLRGTREYGR